MSDKPKHVIILFTDQCRADALGVYGCRYGQTPALDALGNDSVIFDRAVTPSPVCVPARLCMMSGQYCARTGNANNNKFKVWNGRGFYGMMTDAGYDSFQTGKMHYVFDSYGSLGFRARKTQEELSHPEDDYTKFIMSSPYRNVFDYNGHRGEMYYVPQISQLPAEVHPTQWVGDRAVEYLEGCDAENPVFMMASFIHPHPPFCPPAPWNKLFRRDDLPLPFVPSKTPELKYLLDANMSAENLGLSEKDIRKLKNFYYACLSFVDYQVGRIISVLKKRGMYDNALILFASDHGESLGDYDNMGKRTMLSCASRIPFMMKIPGEGHYTRYDPVSLVDVAPTVLGWAGVGYDPEEFDGIDLMHGKHEFVYSQYGIEENATWMVAGEKDKLIYDAPEGKYSYFAVSPEAEDSYDPLNPRVAELKALLDAHMASDVCRKPDDKGKKKRKVKAFGVSRMDHNARADEEAARIPEGYVIDLGLDKYCKQ